MNIDTTLASAILSQTGLTPYPLQKPEEVNPAVVYRRISDRVTDNALEGLGHHHNVRFQITHVHTSYAGLRTLVNNVRTAITTISSAPAVETTIQLENKEADGIYVSIKDYFIFFKDI